MSEEAVSEADLVVPEGAPASPVIQVLKGSPDDDEIAALVAIFTAAAGSGPGPSGPKGPPDMWGTPSLMHRGSPTFAPYAFPHLSHLRD